MHAFLQNTYIHCLCGGIYIILPTASMAKMDPFVTRDDNKVLQMQIPKLDETKVKVSKEERVMSTITAGKSSVQETMFKIMRFITSLKGE